MRLLRNLVGGGGDDDARSLIIMPPLGQIKWGSARSWQKLAFGGSMHIYIYIFDFVKSIWLKFSIWMEYTNDESEVYSNRTEEVQGPG